MLIKWKNGKNFNGDKLFSIETKGPEYFTLAKLLILINQLAKNEWGYFKAKGYDKTEREFFFSKAINDAIEKGKEGIDFLDDKFNDNLLKFCNYYHLDYKRFIQTKLRVFSNGL